MPAKRCPMCHRAGDGRAWQCPCGYEFGQDVAKTRELLRDQLLTAKIMLATFIAIDLGIAAATVAMILHGFVVVSMVVIVGAFTFTIRAGRKILISRESLRALAPAKLPEAIVRRDAT